jgi:hypothetical protein
MRNLLMLAVCFYCLLALESLVGLKDVLVMISVCMVSSMLGIIAVKIKKEL